MYQLNFDKALTDEEKMLRRKYKVLRAKQEQLQEFQRQEEAKRREKEEAEEALSSKAKEEAKKLIVSGEISITPPDEKKQGFKRTTVVKRKLSEGTTQKSTEILKLEPYDYQAATEESKVAQCFFEGKYENRWSSSRNRMSISPASSSAGLKWRSSIESDRSRKDRRAGGYYDYKRKRSTREDDDSGSEED